MLVLRLLHADKIRKDGKKDIPLDDKQLLEVFSMSRVDADKFAFALLKARLLFDRYVIKRELDESWSLTKLEAYDKSKSGFVNTFDDSRHDNIVMLLSMFHVSYPAMNYKHWLSGVMHYLWNGHPNLNSADFLEFLERFNDRLFFGRFCAEPKEYHEIVFQTLKPLAFDRSNLAHGTTIHNFIFNRLDYLIWKRMRSDAAVASQAYGKKGDIKDFRFTFRSSVEHYYPRNPIGGPKLKASAGLPLGVDSFGNLCLISKSKNSKLSNHLPSAKRNYYVKTKAVESLKQQLMMGYGDDWGPENPGNILDHQKAMEALLVCKYSPAKVATIKQRIRTLRSAKSKR